MLALNQVFFFFFDGVLPMGLAFKSCPANLSIQC
jgi:hypothetical protein